MTKTLSLLQPESSGGDNADSGLSFQKQYLLSQIPKWLAMEGFDSLIREATGDIETKFFVPGRGFQLELVEVKNHSITGSEFWKEIQRFQELVDGAPGTYRGFRLVSAGISKKLQPLVNGIKRIHSPYSFYGHGSEIIQTSYDEYCERVEKAGGSAEMAKFLFEKVLLEPNFGETHEYGLGIFLQNFRKYLSHYGDSSSAVDNTYRDLNALVDKRRNQPITRNEIEIEIAKSFPKQQDTSPLPIKIITISTTNDEISEEALNFQWSKFWGGRERRYPLPEIWNGELIEDLRKTQNWVVLNRNNRHIRLEGSRRLSSTIAFGAIFSSVSGFTIEINHRGRYWNTNQHSSTEIPDYKLVTRIIGGTKEGIVVAIGIGRDISESVTLALIHLGLDDLAQLYINGQGPILSDKQANMVVRNIKRIITDSLNNVIKSPIHLFYAGPSPLALFLGHRINALGPIQCYEWVSGNQYAPTCCFCG